MHVVLLRGEHADGDELSDAIRSAGHAVSFLPLLDAAPVDTPRLARALSSDPPPSSIVVTSARGAAALVDAARACDACARARLAAVPVFTVGPRTAEALRAGPCASVCGEGSGSAAALVPEVAAAWQRLAIPSGASAPAPVLFICGDKRLDALPLGLAAAGVPCNEVVAYATAPLSPADTAARWRVLFEDAVRHPPPSALVFFSPSGVDAAHGGGLPLGMGDAAHASSAHTTSPTLTTELSGDSHNAPLLIIALGTSTAAALSAKGVAVHAIALTPDGKGVVAALSEAVGRGRCANTRWPRRLGKPWGEADDRDEET